MQREYLHVLPKMIIFANEIIYTEFTYTSVKLLFAVRIPSIKR